MKRYKKNSWKLVILIAVIIVCIGGVIWFIHDKVLDSSNTVDVESTSGDTATGGEEDDDEDSSEYTEEELKEQQEEAEEETYNFTTQSGEEVKVDANIAVEATGFSGASNYKYYLRGTTLYFLDVSIEDNEEVILAYNVKDLYIENKEVIAELYSDGEIVTENSYITYR